MSYWAKCGPDVCTCNWYRVLEDFEENIECLRRTHPKLRSLQGDQHSYSFSYILIAIPIFSYIKQILDFPNDSGVFEVSCDSATKVNDHLWMRI